MVQRYVIFSRSLRKWHHKIGLIIAGFMLIVALTGLLLGWKKNLNILPPTGKSESFQQWLPLDSLQLLAIKTAGKSGLSHPVIIDRIDVRPTNGVVKVTFEGSFLEVQLDGSTGEVLFAGQRYSDMVEKIHDGSILDFLYNTNGQFFKLTYTTIMATCLMILGITGLGMWYYPKVIRRLKNQEHE